MDIVEQLKRDEGVRQKMYRDSLGIETIGVGHNLRDVPISMAAVERILADDLADIERELRRAFPWVAELSAPRYGVLLNMAFNLGIPRLRGFVNTLGAIKNGAYDAAARGMLASKWATQVGARADRLAEQMRSDTWQ